MADYKFHLKTLPSVERVFSFTPEGRFLEELARVDPLDRDPDLAAELRARLTGKEKENDFVFFNGTRPQVEGKPGEVALLLLGGEGSVEYGFNSLFSLPLSLAGLKKLSSSGEKVWRNTVIVNTPGPLPDLEGDQERIVKLVLLEFPPPWQEFWKISPLGFLHPVSLEKLTLEAEKFSDFLKLGVDPQGHTFLSNVALTLPESSFLELLDQRDLDRLLEVKIKVVCFSSLLQKKL